MASSLPSPFLEAGPWREPHSRKQTSSLPLRHTAPRAPAADLFLSLISPVRLLARQVLGSWVCWAMASRSSCDPQSGSSMLLSLFTLSWRSSYQHCPLLPRPQWNSFSRFFPSPPHPHPPSRAGLFQDRHTQPDKDAEGFCSQDRDPPQQACLLLNSESGFLPGPCLPSPPPSRLRHEATDHQVWKQQRWVVD